MTLRLRDTGIATAYATVGVGEVEIEMRNAAQAANRARAVGKTHKPISDPEILFLLGQADVASIYETRNFNRVFDLRYPSAQSSASVVNWVFSVPYDLGRTAALPDGVFRFILHIRLRRSVFAFRGIETKLIEKLGGLLGSLAESARFHASLGWSDLIIDGTFTAETFEMFSRFIVETHGILVRFGSDGQKRTMPALQRMLTLIGYTGDAPPFPMVDHLTFLRAKPARYDDVIKLLEEHPGRAYALDGKADFMLLTEKPEAGWLQKQRELGQVRHRESLRKVETHAMLFPASRFANANQGDRLVIDVTEMFDRDGCGCPRVSSAAVTELESTMDKLGKLLRWGQRHAIDNTLFLLTAALRDSSICCDAVDAILASYGGLQTILRSMANLANESDRQKRYSHLIALEARLNEWHRFSELLLRQRTVGSYEEFLRQSDRSVVYSGGVQKFLYLADRLIADFAQMVEPLRPPKFATIYDSVKTILGHRVGVVRVPTSKIFNLPFAVADLWHEVAGTLFFLRLGREITFRAPLDQRVVTLERLADHYADILVYLYGFRGDFSKFFSSLTQGWQHTYGDAEDVVKSVSAGEFLARAYLILEFDKVRKVQDDPKAAVEFLDPENADGIVDDLYSYVHPAAKIPVLADDWQQLRRNVVTEDFSDFHRHLYIPFLRVHVKDAGADLKPFLKGEVTDLRDEDDLNALFGELAHSLASPGSKSGTFRSMAALGKSVATEYHRRQVGRRTPVPPPPPAADRPFADRDQTPVVPVPAVVDPDRTPEMKVASEPHGFRRGDRIGKRFKVERSLGSGGMGDVFEVYDTLTRDHVALKFARIRSQEEYDRIRQEVLIARGASHPNLCRVFDMGSYRGLAFLVMELIKGETLTNWMRRNGPTSQERGAMLGHDLFSGLSALHEPPRQILHRDLKPGNVMVDTNSSLRILDFGLAIDATAEQLDLPGTRAYAAPELFSGGTHSTASDVFSAGLILLELFTNRDLTELKQNHRKDGHWIFPASIVQGKPVADLVLPCLSLNPDDRPEAQDLRDRWKKLSGRLKNRK